MLKRLLDLNATKNERKWKQEHAFVPDSRHIWRRCVAEGTDNGGNVPFLVDLEIHTVGFSVKCSINLSKTASCWLKFLLAAEREKKKKKSPTSVAVVTHNQGQHCVALLTVTGCSDVSGPLGAAS